MGEDLTPVRDKPLPDEETILWDVARKFPELAKQLASQKHDLGRVELGYEIKGGIRVQKWLLSLVRPIGDELHYFTKTYLLKKFKGEATARQFINEANKYFQEADRKHRKTLN